MAPAPDETEGRANEKQLGDVIIERGLVSTEPVSGTFTENGDAQAVAADATPRPESDAEWRRRLFQLADDEGDDAAAPAQTQERRPRGLRARAAQRLDEYLAATAAELDERGEMLRQKSLALEREAERIAAAESALDQRAQRTRELGIADEDATRQLDRLVEVVAERDGRIADVTKERDAARSELAPAREKLALNAAEIAERERLLAETEERAVALSAALEAMQAELRVKAVELARARELLDERAARAAELDENTAQWPRAVREETAPVVELLRSPSTHLLSVPGPGCYALVERVGPPPEVGQEVTLVDGDDRHLVVTRVGESPLPLDQRECAYLRVNQ